jgi:DNA transformation protein and related proteins
MSEPVTAIRNLGPASEKEFVRAGLPTADAIRAIGADAAYLRLIETGTRPHFIGYYALVMGLQGRPWHDCKGTEKDRLRVRFDALRARARPRPQGDGPSLSLRRELDGLGVRLDP